jgi:hypothetical protein
MFCNGARPWGHYTKNNNNNNKKKNSNHHRCTPTLQGRIKEKKPTRTKPARKHKEAELHPQGPKAQTLGKQTEQATQEPMNQQNPST